MWIVSIISSITVDFIIKKQPGSKTIIRKIANTIATLGPALALLGSILLKHHKSFQLLFSDFKELPSLVMTQP